MRSDDGGISLKSDAGPESSASYSVGGDKLGLLCPRCAVADKYIRRTLVGMSVNIRVMSPDNHCLTVDVN